MHVNLDGVEIREVVGASGIKWGERDTFSGGSKWGESDTFSGGSKWGDRYVP